MRRVVLQFWISLDGYSCDEGTELFRVMQERPDDEQEDEYFVGRLRQAGTHIMGGLPTRAWLSSGPSLIIRSPGR